MPDVNQVHVGFIRQRRSLIVVSLLLFFYYYADAKIGPSLNVLGVPITLQNPEHVTAVFWIAWVYFLVRYYQYLRDLGDKGFRRAYHESLERYIHRFAVHRMERQFGSENPEFSEIRFEPKSIRTVLATSGTWELEISGDYAYRTPTGGGHQMVGPGLDHIGVPILRRTRARALLHVLASTRLVTEYALPFAVAAAPLVLPLGGLCRWLTRQWS